MLVLGANVTGAFVGSGVTGASVGSRLSHIGSQGS